MVGSRGNGVKVAVALLLAFVCAGCFWRSYGRLAATHAELLAAMARKGVDLVASGRLTAESMPELTYPLERTQAFLQTARARAGASPPGSLVALETLAGRYRSFVDALDQGRRTWRGDEARTALAGPLGEVEAGASAVVAALRAEGRVAGVTSAGAG